MNYFVKGNKSLLTYSLITLIIIPIFGLKILISFLGNIIILLFLIPLLFLLLVFIVFYSYKSKISTCSNCGAISLDSSEFCINCGENLNDINTGKRLYKNPSESTIEVEAEEVK